MGEEVLAGSARQTDQRRAAEVGGAGRPEEGAGKGPGAEKKPRRRIGRPHPIRAIKRHKAIVGRVLILVLAVAVCAVPVFFVNNVFGYLPLLVLVLTVVVSFVYLRILVRGFSFSEESMIPSCERGDDIDFVVHFKNATPLVVVRLEVSLYISDLFGEVDVEIPVTMPLMPFEDRDFSFDACFDHVGTYSAGVKQIKVCDLLGLFSKTIVNEKRHRVEVLPRLFDVSRVELTNVASQDSNKAFKPLVSDDMDYAGVRTYQWGDPLKTIHWKLSARNATKEYYTRLFETYTNPGLTIILDNSADEADSETLMFLFDCLVESALSVNFYARKQGIDSELCYISRAGVKKCTHIVRVDEASSLISDLTRISIGSGTPAFEMLQKETASLHGQDNVAFCTTHINEQIINCLIDMRMRKRNPILFVAVPRGLVDRERREYLKDLRRLDSLGVVYYAISSADELEGADL